MVKTALSVFFISLIVSCSDIPTQSNRILFPLAEKCIGDGASIYLKCDDGTEKVIGLGYGKFYLMNDRKISEALKFCAGDPVEIDVNVKNAHVIHKSLMDELYVESKKVVDSVCVETKKFDDLSDMKKIQVTLTPKTQD